MGIYKVARIVPYVTLLVLALAFGLAWTFTANELARTILVSLASSSLFIVVAYLCYDVVKSWIARRESRYIDSYIRQKVAIDVIALLYTLKKYIHGYALDTNTLANILGICDYTREHIRATMVNSTYLGFQIFRRMDDLRELFRGALQDEVVVKYSPSQYVIRLLRIVDLIGRIEQAFRDEDNYEQSAEPAAEFLCVNGRDLNPENEEGRFLLLKKSGIENRAVVYDSATFEQSKHNMLLDRYTIRPHAAASLAAEVHELCRQLRFWLPDEMRIPRHHALYRVVKDFFTPYTGASTRTKRIHIADIVEFGG